MTMRLKKLAVILAMVIIATLLFTNYVYASSMSRQLRLTVTVVGTLSMDIENEVIHQSLIKPEAEAFSELKDHGILIDKLTSDNSTVWLLTKTE